MTKLTNLPEPKDIEIIALKAQLVKINKERAIAVKALKQISYWADLYEKDDYLYGIFTKIFIEAETALAEMGE